MWESGAFSQLKVDISTRVGPKKARLQVRCEILAGAVSSCVEEAALLAGSVSKAIPASRPAVSARRPAWRRGWQAGADIRGPLLPAGRDSGAFGQCSTRGSQPWQPGSRRMRRWMCSGPGCRNVGKPCPGSAWRRVARRFGGSCELRPWSRYPSRLEPVGRSHSRASKSSPSGLASQVRTRASRAR